MQPADVGDLAPLFRHVRKALALAEVARLDAGRLRSDAVRQEVLVGPGDAVPGGDLEPLGDELHAFDPYFMRGTTGYFFPRSTCRCLACSRWATNAGRTLVMRSFSSLFCALGISTLSTAPSTCS